MHVIEWLITGLLAGLIARIVLKKTHMSLTAEFALGGIGGLLTGTLMRFLGVTSPSGGGLLHVLSALIGAVGTIVTMHMVVKVTKRTGRKIGAKLKLGDIDSALASFGERERNVIKKFIKREIVSRNANIEAQEQITIGQKAADKIAGLGGSWAFIGLFSALLFTWILYNVDSAKSFDPYPFILLNLILSCIAAIQAPVILMSQNRQSEKDRLHAQLDYEVNLKSEVEILALHDKIDALHDQEWRASLLDIQKRQLELLEEIKRLTGKNDVI